MKRSDPHPRLVKLVIAAAGRDAQLVSAKRRPWASVTFVGATHELVLEMWGADAFDRASRLAETIPEKDLPIPGHIVADVHVDRIDTEGDRSVLTLAALTVEDW